MTMEPPTSRRPLSRGGAAGALGAAVRRRFPAGPPWRAGGPA